MFQAKFLKAADVLWSYVEIYLSGILSLIFMSLEILRQLFILNFVVEIIECDLKCCARILLEKRNVEQCRKLANISNISG